MSIAIRVARPSDAAAIATIYMPYVTDTVISFEMAPPDKAEMANRLAKTLARFPWLVAESDGEVVGYAYAGQHRERAAYQWSADVSVYVHKALQRRGIGERALRIIMHAAQADALPVRLQVIKGNTAKRLYDRLGFEVVGEDDQLFHMRRAPRAPVEIKAE